jgi:hypothetical protein
LLLKLFIKRRLIVFFDFGYMGTLSSTKESPCRQRKGDIDAPTPAMSVCAGLIVCGIFYDIES